MTEGLTPGDELRKRVKEAEEALKERLKRPYPGRTGPRRVGEYEGLDREKMERDWENATRDGRPPIGGASDD
jgi:hypothetical protein